MFYTVLKISSRIQCITATTHLNIWWIIACSFLLPLKGYVGFAYYPKCPDYDIGDPFYPDGPEPTKGPEFMAPVSPLPYDCVFGDYECVLRGNEIPLEYTSKDPKGHYITIHQVENWPWWKRHNIPWWQGGTCSSWGGIGCYWGFLPH